MPARLVALDDGVDIILDRTMLVVGRHPQCDARIDSLRISRHHCCMTQDGTELVVRDLGSTNGIRINGQRIEFGRLRPGDELSIAHIRYRLDDGGAHEKTLVDPSVSNEIRLARLEPDKDGADGRAMIDLEHPVAMAVRDVLPAGLAEKCRIQVILQVDREPTSPEVPIPCRPDSSP